MALIVTSCPIHGDLVVPAVKVTLHLGVNDDSYYQFPCGKCGENVTKPATPHTLTVLGDTVTAHLINTNLDEELRRLLT